MNLVFDYIVSLTNLYGIVHREKVIEIYNQQNKEKIDSLTIEQLVQEKSEKLSEQFSEVHGDFFVHESIMHFNEFDLEMAKKKGKPFYIPPKYQLLKYKDEFYFEKTKEYRNLFRYVKKHVTRGNEYKAREICEDIHGQCEAGGSPRNILDEFNRREITFESEKQVQEVLNLAMDLANNTRIWENNGHTPNEIFEKYEKPHMQPLSTGTVSNFTEGNPEITVTPNDGVAPKVGRNDPCPCGSGKKYKKCCLGK